MIARTRGGKTAPRQHSKIQGKMKRRKTKREQQGCDVVVKVIDTVEQAVSTAKKVYRAEPPVNAIIN